MSCDCCQKVTLVAEYTTTFTSSPPDSTSSSTLTTGVFSGSRSSWWMGQSTGAMVGASVHNDTDPGGPFETLYSEHTVVTFKRTGFLAPFKLRYNLVTYDLITTDVISSTLDIEFSYPSILFADLVVDIPVPGNEQYTLMEDIRVIFPIFDNY